MKKKWLWYGIYGLLPVLTMIMIITTTFSAIIFWLQQEFVLFFWPMEDFIPFLWLGVILSLALLSLLITIYLPLIVIHLNHILIGKNYGKN